MNSNYIPNVTDQIENHATLYNDLLKEKKRKFIAENKLENFQGKDSKKQQQPYFKQTKQNIKSRISLNPILQPQQPQNYLNLSKQNKQVSILSCKSQPIDLTIQQNDQHKSISVKNYHLKDQLGKNNEYQNENKKTRKYLTRPIDNFQQTDQNTQNQYYKVGSFQDLRKQKTLKQINSKYLNENTLRIKKSPCRHKSNKKQKQHLKSLQNISNRISFCEAYIELSQRKTNFLAKQIDYLLNKEFLRESKKFHKNRHEKMSHSYSQRVIEPKFEPFKPQIDYFQKSKRHKCSHKTQKKLQKQEQYQSEINSKNRFHFRSNDNKSSRMKQLIYFQQKNHDYKNYIKSAKDINRQGKQKDFKRYEQSSIYCSRSHHKQRLNKSKKDKINNQNHIIQNDKLHKKQNQLKSKDKSYQDDSSYLLLGGEQYQTSTKNVYKNVKSNNILPGQQEVPYINSELVPESLDQKSNLYQEDDSQNGSSKNIYLTKQFQVSSATNNKRSLISQNRKSSKKETTPDKRKLKVGHFNPMSQDFIGQKGQNQVVQNRTISSKKGKVLADSGKSSQMFKQKQYTFLNYEQTNKKEHSLSNYKVIESNFTSPKHFDSEASENNSKQSQLIEQFNYLVVAAEKQETPIKKKIIQQQIYKTSKELKQINERKVKSELKNHTKN